MTEVSVTEMVTNLGMKDDAHAKANSKRQLLLLEVETLHSLGLQPGDVKENITTSGIELMNLLPGTRLQLGNDAILEITQECDPCYRMDELRAGLQQELAGRRGMLATVVSGGNVSQGDSIHVLENRR